MSPTFQIQFIIYLYTNGANDVLSHLRLDNGACVNASREKAVYPCFVWLIISFHDLNTADFML